MKQFTISYAWRVVLAGLVLAGGPSACTYKKVNPECVAPTPAAVSYQRDVWPILKTNCRDACHNPQSASQYANFNMDVFTQVRDFSVNKPANLPSSYLLGNIRHEQGYVNMPVGAGKLSDCDIATIEAWVAAGTPNN